MKATKKPVTIECIKWDGNNKDEVEYFCGKSALFYPNISTGTEELSIKTLEGNHHASIGDIIIKGVNGEFYPCKPDIFEKTYNIVPNDTEIETDDSFTHSFSWALEMMKKGHKIHRSGWNGKGMFAVLQKGYPQGIPCNKQTAEAWGLKEGDLFRCEPYMQLKMVNGSHSMWVPSVNDCLSNDWAIVVTDISGTNHA